MNSPFFNHVKETFIQLIKVSFPLVLLTALLSYWDTGVFWGSLFAVILITIEVRIVFKSTIPWISEIFSFLLSDSSSPPNEDVLVEAAQLLKKERDVQGLTAALRRYTDENPKLLRAWLLRASFLCDDPLYKYDEAIDSLKEALTSARWGKEDKAMLLFKIGNIYERHLNNMEKASAYYADSARRYPRTAYGKQACSKLKGNY